MDGIGFALVQCDADGRPLSPIEPMPKDLAAACAQSADLYRRIGYAAPWVSYVACDAGVGVGGGAFVGAPRDGVVEIAYFTLPQFERRGYATHTANHLVAIARAASPSVVVKACTLPERNVSTRILERLGFRFAGLGRDKDVGEVWEWRA